MRLELEPPTNQADEADLEALLKVEVANEAALEELKEIESLRKRSIAAKVSRIPWCASHR